MKKTKTTAAERIDQMVEGIYEVLTGGTTSQDEILAAITQSMLEFSYLLGGDPLMTGRQRVARYFIDVSKSTDE